MKPNRGKGGNMGQHKMEGTKSCRCRCYYERPLTGKGRVRD